MRKIIQASLISITVLALNAPADELKPQPQRDILERHDQSGVAGKEIVVGYVLKGTLTLKTKDQADRVLHAGDSLFNVRGAVHSVAAEPGGSGGMAVSTWIVDKGVPLATPVP
jgi:hypothetical protein